MDEVIEKLKELGFNEYQSKVYIALLKNFQRPVMKLANLQIFRNQELMIHLKILRTLILF